MTAGPQGRQQQRTRQWFRVAAWTAVFGLGATAGVPVTSADGSGLTTAWVEGFNNRARLHAGRVDGSDGPAIYGGIEIAMPVGWKTYWRTPGEAGGIPPELDISDSVNVAEAKLLFPAPRRLIDKSGAVIGYKNAVIFPFILAPLDASQPMRVEATINYGVCNDLCVPAEATLRLDVPANAPPSQSLADALSRVPGMVLSAGNDPVLTDWRIDGSGDEARLMLEVKDPGLAAGSQPPEDYAGDAFVEAPNGQYMPLPQRTALEGTAVRYQIELRNGVSLADLKGKQLTVTLTGATGQSETALRIE